MSREDPFLVRHSSVPAVGESNAERAVINRLGFQVVVDFYTQMILAGFGYHMQIGTEAVPVNSTTTVDDQLVWMLADNAAGLAIIPLRYQVALEVVGAATIIASYLEIDKDKVRYSSGGTTYVPANLRGDDPNTANGTFKVGTDVAAAAKSAVPNTVEFSRFNHLEDALANTIGYPMGQEQNIFTVWRDGPIVAIDASSVLCHHGATTGDTSSYGNLQFLQFPKTLVI